MANELMIPEKSDVPSYIQNPELARQANEEAAAGISTGFPARVKISGKMFALIDGNGEETPFPPAKMVDGGDGNVYMPMIVLRAKKALSKAWYATAYNPAVEAEAPDCFSNDSERPDSTVVTPQSDTCAACPHNAFGSGKDQNGNPTAGKACSDTKMLAVFVPGCGVHAFKIPPASLKNFGLYVKQLSAAGIPLGTVKSLVGFDLTASFPILVFRFGGYIGEELIPKLVELSTSQEAEEIIEGVTVAKVAPKLEAPSAVAAAPPVVDDLGLGVEVTPSAAPPAPAAPTPSAPPVAPAAPAAPAAQEVTDAELMKELGL